MILTKGKKDDQFLDMFRQHDFKMKKLPSPRFFSKWPDPFPPWQLKVKNMHL